MSLQAHVFTKFATAMLSKSVQFVSTPDTISCMLLTSANNGPAGTTNVQDSAEYVSDVVSTNGGTGPCAELATAGGYTIGGVSCGTPTISIANHVLTVSGLTDPSWTANSTGFNAYYGLFFDSTGGSQTADQVICWWDFGGVQNPVSTMFTLQISASGLLTITGT